MPRGRKKAKTTTKKAKSYPKSNAPVGENQMNAHESAFDVKIFPQNNVQSSFTVNESFILSDSASDLLSPKSFDQSFCHFESNSKIPKSRKKINTFTKSESQSFVNSEIEMPEKKKDSKKVESQSFLGSESEILKNKRVSKSKNQSLLDSEIEIPKKKKNSKKVESLSFLGSESEILKNKRVSKSEKQSLLGSENEISKNKRVSKSKDQSLLGSESGILKNKRLFETVDHPSMNSDKGILKNKRVLKSKDQSLLGSESEILKNKRLFETVDQIDIQKPDEMDSQKSNRNDAQHSGSLDIPDNPKLKKYIKNRSSMKKNTVPKQILYPNQMNNPDSEVNLTKSENITHEQNDTLDSKNESQLCVQNNKRDSQNSKSKYSRKIRGNESIDEKLIKSKDKLVNSRRNKVSYKMKRKRKSRPKVDSKDSVESLSDNGSESLSENSVEFLNDNPVKSFSENPVESLSENTVKSFIDNSVKSFNKHPAKSLSENSVESISDNPVKSLKNNSLKSLNSETCGGEITNDQEKESNFRYTSNNFINRSISNVLFGQNQNNINISKKGNPTIKPTTDIKKKRKVSEMNIDSTSHTDDISTKTRSYQSILSDSLHETHEQKKDTPLISNKEDNTKDGSIDRNDYSFIYNSGEHTNAIPIDKNVDSFTPNSGEHTNVFSIDRNYDRVTPNPKESEDIASNSSEDILSQNSTKKFSIESLLEAEHENETEFGISHFKSESGSNTRNTGSKCSEIRYEHNYIGQTSYSLKDPYSDKALHKYQDSHPIRDTDSNKNRFLKSDSHQIDNVNLKSYERDSDSNRVSPCNSDSDQIKDVKFNANERDSDSNITHSLNNDSHQIGYADLKSFEESTNHSGDSSKDQETTKDCLHFDSRNLKTIVNSKFNLKHSTNNPQSFNDTQSALLFDCERETLFDLKTESESSHFGLDSTTNTGSQSKTSFLKMTNELSDFLNAKSLQNIDHSILLSANVRSEDQEINHHSKSNHKFLKGEDNKTDCNMNSDTGLKVNQHRIFNDQSLKREDNKTDCKMNSDNGLKVNQHQIFNDQSLKRENNKTDCKLHSDNGLKVNPRQIFNDKSLKREDNGSKTMHSSDCSMNSDNRLNISHHSISDHKSFNTKNDNSNSIFTFDSGMNSRVLNDQSQNRTLSPDSLQKTEFSHRFLRNSPASKSESCNFEFHKKSQKPFHLKMKSFATKQQPHEHFEPNNKSQERKHRFLKHHRCDGDTLSTKGSPQQSLSFKDSFPRSMSDSGFKIRLNVEEPSTQDILENEIANKPSTQNILESEKTKNLSTQNILENQKNLSTQNISDNEKNPSTQNISENEIAKNLGTQNISENEKNLSTQNISDNEKTPGILNSLKANIKNFLKNIKTKNIDRETFGKIQECLKIRNQITKTGSQTTDDSNDLQGYFQNTNLKRKMRVVGDIGQILDIEPETVHMKKRKTDFDELRASQTNDSLFNTKNHANSLSTNDQNFANPLSTNDQNFVNSLSINQPIINDSTLLVNHGIINDSTLPTNRKLDQHSLSYNKKLDKNSLSFNRKLDTNSDQVRKLKKRVKKLKNKLTLEKTKNLTFTAIQKNKQNTLQYIEQYNIICNKMFREIQRKNKLLANIKTPDETIKKYTELGNKQKHTVQRFIDFIKNIDCGFMKKNNEINFKKYFKNTYTKESFREFLGKIDSVEDEREINMFLETILSEKCIETCTKIENDLRKYKNQDQLIETLENILISYENILRKIVYI